MAVQVNVFGQQLKAVDLLSPDERLKNILNASRNGSLPLTAEQITNESRWANEAGVPAYLDQTHTISGGSAVTPFLEFDKLANPDSSMRAEARNRASLSERQQQQWRSLQASRVRRPLLGQNEEFTPEVQMYIDEQIAMGNDPTANLTDEQLNAARQTGLITVKGGITHLTSDEKMGGRQGLLPPKHGDIARFFSPSYDAEEIVGQATNNDPSLIPTGVGGVSERASSNKGAMGLYGQKVLGAWTQMERDKVVSKVNWLRGVREQVEDSIFTASIDNNTQTMSELGKILEAEFGAGAATNPSISGVMVAAYYAALNQSRFAKHSQDDEINHEKYREQNEGRNDPSLWESSPEGKSAQTPMLSVLTEAIGEQLENVGSFKFSNPQMKNLFGDVVRKLFANLGPSVSFLDERTKYMGPESGEKFINMADLARKGLVVGMDVFPVKGVSFEELNGKKHLGEIMGIVNILNPGMRKNPLYSAPAEIALDQKDPQQNPAIKGVSSVRNSAKNIQQGFVNKLDPYVTNLLANLVRENPQWNHIVHKVLKVQETGVNILLQQKQNIADNGGIFFNSITQQAGGRHATGSLAGMQNLNGQRIATIPATPTKHTLSKELNPKNYTDSEKLFVAAVMSQISYNEWGDNLSGNDNLRYSSIERRWQQLLDPKHPLRMFQEKMLKYEQALRTNKDIQAVDFGIEFTDGMKYLTDKNAMQGLWSMNEFLKAKEKGSTEFLDPYITGLDSNQNGLFGIGVQIGDMRSVRSGGGRTETFNSPFFKDETGILESDKTYMQTLGMARSVFLQRMQEDKDLSDFADLFFMNADADKGLSNLFQKEFAKKAVMGGQYGEQGRANAISMRTGFLEWLEGLDTAIAPATEQKNREKIMQSINEWAGVGGADLNYYLKKGTRENEDEPIPEIYYKVDKNNERKWRPTNKIRIQGEAYKQMHKIAEIFNFAMHETSPGIADYTAKMKDIYTVMVEMAAYSNDWNLDFMNGIELRIREPNVTDPNKPIYTKDGLANGWSEANGIRINLLDSMVEESFTAIPLEGWLANEAAGGFDEAQWQERKVWLRKPSRSYKQDVQQEMMALDSDSPVRPRSAGLTRFPVVSLHVLDDLAMSITMHELKRKYGNEFDWANSVWDEGLVRKTFRERFADEYNKAWMAVLLENNYFKNMADSFDTALLNMDPAHLAHIHEKNSNGKYVRPRAVDAYDILEDKIKELVHDAQSIQLGNHERGNVDKIMRYYMRYGTANMNPNTPKYEKQLKMVDGEMVAKRTHEYNQRDEKSRFSKSIIDSAHPGSLIGASQKDRLAYIKSIRGK